MPFRAGNRTLAIATDDGWIDAHIRRVYRRLSSEQLATDAAHDRGSIVRDGAGFAVTFNGRPATFSPKRRPDDAFKAAFHGSSKLFRMSFQLDDEFLALYAAGLCVEGRGVLIAAHSGTGKTTLTLELLRRGATFYGDEFSLIDKTDMRLRGFPRTMLIREPTLSLLAMDRLREVCASSPARGEPGQRSWDYVDAADVFGEDVYAQPSPLRAVFALSRDERGGPAVRRISPSVAAAKIYSRVSGEGVGIDKLASIATLLLPVPCFELSAGAVAPTASLLRETVAACA